METKSRDIPTEGFILWGGCTAVTGCLTTAYEFWWKSSSFCSLSWIWIFCTAKYNSARLCDITGIWGRGCCNLLVLCWGYAVCSGTGCSEMSINIGMSGQIKSKCLMRLGPSSWGRNYQKKKKKKLCMYCVLCLIQTYNVNSYNILGLH